MPIITGSGTFTNGSPNITAITGLSQLITGVVDAGNWLKVNEETVKYDIALDATAETALTMDKDYQGVTGAKSFQIFTDFIDGEIPYLSTGITGSFYILNEIFKIFIDRCAAAGAPEQNVQILTLTYLGEPEDDFEFGYFKSSAPIEIDKIRLRTDNLAPDNTVTIDYSVEDVYQNEDLQMTSSGKSVETAELTTVVAAGEVVKFKWKNIVLPAGNTYYVDIVYHTTSTLKIRYDFNATVPGILEAGQEIWANFKFPVKSKVFAVVFEGLDYLGEGGDCTYELLKDGVSLGTPVTYTIPEGQRTYYIALAQTDFEITETCSIKINAVGTIPPQNIITRLHSYQIE